MIRVDDIPVGELGITAIQSGGPGGQHVNKVATAIQLTFDVRQSSLPAAIRARLLEMKDSRITRDGVIVIKAHRHRSQERNRQDALARLDGLLVSAQQVVRKRQATRPTLASKKRRLDNKKKRGQKKSWRGRVDPDR